MPYKKLCGFAVLNEKLASPNSKTQIFAYFCHTGEVDKDSEIVAASHNPRVILMQFSEE